MIYVIKYIVVSCDDNVVVDVVVVVGVVDAAVWYY